MKRLTDEEKAVRRAYLLGWSDAMAAVMAAATAAVEHCEAVAATFAQVPGVAADTGARLMTAAADQIRGIVARVQEAQTGAKPW